MNGWRVGAVVLLCLAGGIPVVAQSVATTGGRWKLAWHDEFDGETLNPQHWDLELGDGFYNYDANTWIGGWGNGELQTYTADPKNVSVADGSLHIRAFKESFQGRGYTSARVISRMRDGRPLFNQRYGRFEIRAKLPTGQGIWPALWMLPQDNRYGTWAASGEIDIVETRGQQPNVIHGTIHFGSRWPANASATESYTLPDGQAIDQFHVYAIEWEPGEIRWFINDHLYAKQTAWWSSSKLDGDRGAAPRSEADVHPWPAPFDQPFYLILNVAVGGQFVGSPDPQTPFPAEMQIDYVRVYERVGGYDDAARRPAGTLPFED